MLRKMINEKQKIIKIKNERDSLKTFQTLENGLEIVTKQI